MKKERKVQFSALREENTAQTLNIVKNFSNVNNNMKLLTAGIYSLVAINEGVTNKDVCEYFGVPKARASRNIQALTNNYKLIKQKTDVQDNRVKNLYLTTKGQDFKERLGI